MVKKLTNIFSIRNYSENNQQTSSGEKETMKENNTKSSQHGVSRAVFHPVAVRAFIVRRRLFVVAFGASTLILVAVGVATTHGLMNQETPQETTHETHAEGSSVTTMTETNSASENDSTAPDVKTQVIVNGQPVSVPENGSVSRTVTNDNGTTQVEISNNSNSDGSSVSSSVTTNNISTSTNTFSHDVHIQSSP